MTINCHDEDDFFDTIERLVRRGLGFDADSARLKIYLTGSY